MKHSEENRKEANLKLVKNGLTEMICELEEEEIVSCPQI